MKLSEQSRQRMRIRREERRLKAQGYEREYELRSLRVGFHAHERRVTECVVGPCGRSVWVKTELRP